MAHQEDSQPGNKTSGARADGIAPFERLKPPPELDGRDGVHRIRAACRIAVDTDLDAVRYWIERTSEGDSTARARRSAVEKLLNWAYFRRRKALSSFERQDFGEFIAFIATPSPAETWIAPSGTARSSNAWRPFVRPADPVSQDAIGSHVSSLLTYLRQQNYADLYYAHGKRNVRDGLADSRSAFQRVAGANLTEPMPLQEWKWICRWLDGEEGESVASLDRLVVELLYYGELKLIEISALCNKELASPLNGDNVWVLELLSRDRETIRTVRYLPEPLNKTLQKWFGNESTPTWVAFHRGELLLELSVDSLRDLVRSVFEGAANLAAYGDEVAIAAKLRMRTPLSLRHAYRSHRRGSMDILKACTHMRQKLGI